MLEIQNALILKKDSNFFLLDGLSQCSMYAQPGAIDLLALYNLPWAEGGTPFPKG